MRDQDRDQGVKVSGFQDYKKDISTPVQYLKGVGPRLAKILSKLGIHTIEDLIYYFPRDYEDRRNISQISKLRIPEEKVFVKGTIAHVENQKKPGRLSILKVTLQDISGSIKLIFFNQPFLLKVFYPGVALLVSGKVEFNSYEGAFQLVPRDWEIDEGEPLKIVPVYNLTEGLFAKTLRNIIKTALDQYLSSLKEPLPDEILKENRLIDILEAVKNLHFPQELKIVEEAKRRIIFEDFFVFQVGLGNRKKEIKTLDGIKFNSNADLLSDFPLPFKLTGAQERVLDEILNDMSQDRPMNRLIQGDVGSGKTVVAAMAAFVAIKNGYQVAIMAPTEILAQQHYEKFIKWFGAIPVAARLIALLLVTGTTQSKNKRELIEADVVVGTHALIQEKIKFKKLGLVVVDEQHRFGVLQRAELGNKGRRQNLAPMHPDVLFMTATPIPRSLALTLYGDLDRSIIDEMPPGRQPVKTYYVSNSKRRNSYEFIRTKIKEGRQVFVVCPLVKETEKSDLKAAVEESEYLQRDIFPEFKIGLIHGRVKQSEKERIMWEFRNNKIQLLVSTTVIEVGIDIPNASIMVIEHSERFGLSQLHQLRGRIGRGAHESFCFLMGEPKSKDARIRIKAMIDSNDGFKIAEVDLRLRGPGDFCGVRQSGLPEFRMADIVRDEKILQVARDSAFKYLASDPHLEKAPQLKKNLVGRYGRFLGF